MSLINDHFKMEYIPARVCKGKDLCVKYYVWDPEINKRKRKVIRFNHMRSNYPMKEIIRLMNKAAVEINIKLESGINPIMEGKMPKGYTKLQDVFGIFLSIKEKEMRSDGFRSYKSFINKLSNWLIINKYNLYVVFFDKDKAVEFLTFLELDSKIGSRSYNNHLVFFKTFWNWLIEKNYCADNVFQGFRKKKVEEKIRQLIPSSLHIKICEYCKYNMQNMEVIIDLIRASFIRPAEICRLQISNIKLDDGVIEIPSGKSKNKNFRYAYLPKWLVDKIRINFKPEIYPLNYYFVTRSLTPGTKKIGTRELDKKWDKIRTDLNFGIEYQLYSYRDTGITFLENKGIPRNIIQKLTDHHSEKMVGKYVGGPSKELMEGVVNQIY
jgi:integrase